MTLAVHFEEAEMDFVNVLDLGSDGVVGLVESAARMKADPASVAGSLAGARVGLFFQKPSTRTRVSCEVGTAQLGAQPIVLKNDEVGLGTREAPQDVAQVLERYLDVLAFRVFDHADLVTMAQHAAAPVINLLSDLEHPCQAIADLQTVAELRPLDGATVAFIGDGNNVAHSLMVAGAAAGVTVRVAAPEGYQPRPEFVELAASGPGTVEIFTDPYEAVAGADVVYTDVWTSMGSESEAAERHERFIPFRVDLPLFEAASDDAIFMHCLPAHRGEEVTDEVMDHPRSRVYDQSENRLHSFKAILHRLAS
jgi:ornithine carbamoyltransferase